MSNDKIVREKIIRTLVLVGCGAEENGTLAEKLRETFDLERLERFAAEPFEQMVADDVTNDQATDIVIELLKELFPEAVL